MRYIKGLVTVAAAALVLAACSTNETSVQTLEPQAFVNPPILAPGVTWNFTDGFSVGVTGTGMGNDGAVLQNPANLAIPDVADVAMIRVQVQIKGGPDDFPYTDPEKVVFTSSAGEIIEVSAPAAAPGDNGYFETNFGRHYEAWMQPADTVTAEVFEPVNVSVPPCTDQCTPRAFNAWIFYNADATRLANSGSLSHHDLWWGTKVLDTGAGPQPRATATDTLAIPTATEARDVTVKFAISDLANDGRTAEVTASAGGVSVTEVYSNASAGYEQELLIASITLVDVPGAASSVDVTFTSPDGDASQNPSLSGGDSFFASGVAVTADQPPPPPPGGEGCTPGFWKNRGLRIGAWSAQYPPETLVGDVWDIPAELDSSIATSTLLEALSWSSGDTLSEAAQMLIHQATAALQNALSPDVAYDLTAQQIIDGGNAALASLDRDTILDLKDVLDFLNNQHNNDLCGD